MNAKRVLVRKFILLGCAALTCLLSVGRSYAQDEVPLPGLWIDLSMGAPLVELFNERAGPQDIARVEHISQLDLLSDVTAGKKLVVFKSAGDAIRLLPHIYQEIDIVGYNLEHGPANPVNEQENPIESVQRLREAVDQYGLELAVGPDHRFAESDGVAMAPYADYFILQIQRVQTDSQEVYDFVEPLIAALHKANPDLAVSLQVRTEGSVDELVELIEPLQDTIQGISILTSEETLLVAEELVSNLRPAISNPPAGPEENAEAGPLETAGPLAQSPAAAATDSPVEAVDNSLPAGSARDEAALTTATAIGSEAMAAERSGTNGLLIVVALVVGFALGAGYISHRTSS